MTCAAGTFAITKRTIAVDQAWKSCPRDVDLWAYTKGITLGFPRPGKPTDNAYVKVFVYPRTLLGPIDVTSPSKVTARARWK